MDNEVWKTYPEYPFIEGSTMGRVRTLDRMVSNGRGTYVVKRCILKQYHNKKGYLRVVFSVNGKTVSRLVHRIIAECFLPNHGNLPQINHRNCIRDDDRLTNLEWCDASYNMRYREKYGVSQTEACGHPVYAINLKTQEVSRFRSQHEASRQLGIYQSNISAVIKGKQKTAKGYWFVKVNENAVEATRNKLGDVVADKIEELMNDKETQLA